MPRPFRLAIVGTGKITAESHLPAARAAAGVETVALVDPVVERAERLVRQHGLRAAVAPTLAPVLDGLDGPDGLDGVLLATPNHTHAALVLECLAAGVPVLVEKPLTSTLEDAERVVAAAEAAGVTLAVGYCTRFQPEVELVHGLLRTGWFGAVQRFAYQYGSLGGWASESGFHLDRAAVGGGLLVTMGTHFLDRLLHWFGAPDEVALEDDSLGGPEANAVARFRWQRDGGFAGSARFSKTAALPGGFVMEAQRGTLVLRDAPGQPALFRPADAPGLELLLRPRDAGPAAGGLDLFRLQLEDFVAACREGRPPRVSAREGLASVQLVADLYAHRTPLAVDAYASAAGGAS